jgi:hypothetical protein
MTTITKTFILAGKAIFTIANGKPAPLAADYTYRVSHKAGRDGRGDIYFVGLLTGSDNESDYTYVGVLDTDRGAIRLTAKSVYTADSKPVVAFNWAVGRIFAGRDIPAPATALHAGRCGKCARLLTVPESIELGLGPECSTLGYTKPRNERKPRAKKAPKPTFAELRAAAEAANLAAGETLVSPVVPDSDTSPEIDPELEAERLLATVSFGPCGPATATVRYEGTPGWSGQLYGGQPVGCYRCLDAGCLYCAPIGSDGVLKGGADDDRT